MNTPQPPQPSTGDALKAMRDVAGMSRRGLAKAVECSHQHLSCVEAGTRPLTHDLAQRVAIAITNHVNAAA